MIQSAEISNKLAMRAADRDGVPCEYCGCVERSNRCQSCGAPIARTRSKSFVPPPTASQPIRFALMVAAILWGSSTEAISQEIEPQIVIPCEVVEVYDGDTVTVRLTLDVRVRLLDCWSPEVRTRDAIEKQYGIHSRETLQELVSDERCLLIVPLQDANRFDDLFTFGRLLARLQLIESGLDISKEMMRMGVAMEVKR